MGTPDKRIKINASVFEISFKIIIHKPPKQKEHD
jgi:hypothetical protein